MALQGSGYPSTNFNRDSVDKVRVETLESKKFQPALYTGKSSSVNPMNMANE